MKKSLVALAVLGMTGAACAQSSVTLFGIVDLGASYYTNKTENAQGQAFKTSQTALTSGNFNSSRLGLRGTEDLGGGLAAGFWLEAAIFPDTGSTGGNVANSGGAVTGLFNRRSTVSLSGRFGEVRLGRDYTPSFWNDTVFDPFGSNGVGASLILTANGFSSNGSLTNGFSVNNQYVRSSNSIGYFLPANLGGAYGQLMYAFNEKTSYDPAGLTPPTAAAVSANPALATPGNERAGRYVGGRAGWANGAFDIAVSYAQTTVASNFYRGTTSNLDSASIGASYDFGVVKLFGEYGNAQIDVQQSAPGAAAIGEPSARGWLVGATVPVGPGLIRLAYSAVDYKDTLIARLQPGSPEPKADKFALGYVHNLSKRTALYATAAIVNNKNGADLLVGGTANFVQPVAGVTGPLTPKSSTGYDMGIRHSF